VAAVVLEVLEVLEVPEVQAGNKCARVPSNPDEPRQECRGSSGVVESDR